MPEAAGGFLQLKTIPGSVLVRNRANHQPLGVALLFRLCMRSQPASGNKPESCRLALLSSQSALWAPWKHWKLQPSYILVIFNQCRRQVCQYKGPAAECKFEALSSVSEHWHPNAHPITCYLDCLVFLRCSIAFCAKRCGGYVCWICRLDFQLVTLRGHDVRFNQYRSHAAEAGRGRRIGC